MNKILKYDNFYILNTTIFLILIILLLQLLLHIYIINYNYYYSNHKMIKFSMII